jgi:ParB-like chromosome segregation protein Spo0J
MKHTMVNPAKLLPHPFNEKIYGRETLNDEFVESIRARGVDEPVVVVSTTIDRKPGLYILSGHRRVEAAIKVGCDVPVRFLPDEGREWQEGFLLEANRQRVKTPEQMAREYVELKRIEAARAEQQRQAGTPLVGTASGRASTQVGIADPWARKMEVVIREADEGNPVAVAGLAAINKHETNVEAVYRSISEREKDAVGAHYTLAARKLESDAGMFTVTYSPRALDPKHGFVFKTRFVCVEEAEAFLKMIGKIPAEAREEFERQSRSWRR